jgi:small-conductance mechanosensitive channel
MAVPCCGPSLGWTPVLATVTSFGTLLAAFGPFRDLGHWFRREGLEIVLLVSGAVLFIRAVRCLLARSAEGFGGWGFWTERVVRPEAELSADLRRRQALSQAAGWLISALVIVVVGSLVALRLGVPLSTVVPPATVAGVAVGFGAQKLVQDVLSGFFLLAERQITVGDVVRISDPGTTTGVGGTVEEVTLRVTRLRTLKGEVVFIPNGEIRQVTNLSKDWARVVLDIPLAVDTDVPRATDVLRRISEEIMEDEAWAPVLLDPPSVMGIERFAVGFLQLRFVARTLPGRQWDVARELRGRITLAFQEAGVPAPSLALDVARSTP